MLLTREHLKTERSGPNQECSLEWPKTWIPPKWQTFLSVNHAKVNLRRPPPPPTPPPTLLLRSLFSVYFLRNFFLSQNVRFFWELKTIWNKTFDARHGDRKMKKRRIFQIYFSLHWCQRRNWNNLDNLRLKKKNKKWIFTKIIFIKTISFYLCNVF